MEIFPNQLTELPTKPGVYIFKDSTGLILYVGKAINLKARVGSYFSKTGDGRPKLRTLIPQINTIETIEVLSEFEALILEAALIKKHIPKYNTAAKDDKQPLYISITSEDFPKIRTIRRNQITELDQVYGPFPSAGTVKQVLKSLRKIFPFCSCELNRGRPCLNAAIGLCNPSPRAILVQADPTIQAQKKREYRRKINYIRQLLEGKSNKVITDLTEHMEQSAQSEQFESAAEYRDTIARINTLLQPRNPAKLYLNNPYIAQEIRQYGLDELQRVLNLTGIQPPVANLHRIEGYDIATLLGKQTTGSLVVFYAGEPLNSDYRHFRISQEHAHADILSMNEMLSRRFSPKHSDWPLPDLIVVDGGLTQLRAAQASLTAQGINLPLVGLAKRYEQLYVPLFTASVSHLEKPAKSYTILTLDHSSPALHIVQHLRDEAHRFARRYHHKLRKKKVLES